MLKPHGTVTTTAVSTVVTSSVTRGTIITIVPFRNSNIIIPNHHHHDHQCYHGQISSQYSPSWRPLIVNSNTRMMMMNKRITRKYSSSYPSSNYPNENGNTNDDKVMKTNAHFFANQSTLSDQNHWNSNRNNGPFTRRTWSLWMALFYMAALYGILRFLIDLCDLVFGDEWTSFIGLNSGDNSKVQRRITGTAGQRGTSHSITTLIRGNSMAPCMVNGDRVVLDANSNNLKRIERGDIVALTAPDAPEKKVIKRVVGLPGDRVQLSRLPQLRECPSSSDGTSKRKKRRAKTSSTKERNIPYEQNEQPLAVIMTDQSGSDGCNEQAAAAAAAEDTAAGYLAGKKVGDTVIVPPGHIWIEGDNSKSSRDSRDYGPVPMGLVFAKATHKLHRKCDNEKCIEERVPIH